MTRITDMSDKDLQMARDLGAATYLNAYIHLMAKELGITGLTLDAANEMAQLMIEPLDLGTEAAFRWLMNDAGGAKDAVRRLQVKLMTIQPVQNAQELADRKLVYVLQQSKRPSEDAFHNGVLGLSETAVCLVKASGEVYVLDPASVEDVMVVLAGAPYHLVYSDLKDVYLRER